MIIKKLFFFSIFLDLYTQFFFKSHLIIWQVPSKYPISLKTINPEKHTYILELQKEINEKNTHMPLIFFLFQNYTLPATFFILLK
jgi:hypothetical protein